MGISRGTAKFLLNESCRRPFSGKVLTLGRMDIGFSYESLKKWAAEFGIELSSQVDLALEQLGRYKQEVKYTQLVEQWKSRVQDCIRGDLSEETFKDWIREQDIYGIRDS